MANTPETETEMKEDEAWEVIETQGKRHGMTGEALMEAEINLLLRKFDLALDDVDTILLEVSTGGEMPRFIAHTLLKPDENIDEVIGKIRRERRKRRKDCGAFVTYDVGYLLGNTVIEESTDPNMQVFTPEPVNAPNGEVVLFHHPSPPSITWVAPMKI